MNFEGNEGVGVAVMTIIAGVAAWVRGERLRNSKADRIISEDAADRTITNGHNEEFRRLQDAVAKLMPLSQEVEMLKAKLAGIWVYCEMLLLCESCSHNNEKIIQKMQEALDPVVKSSPECTDERMHAAQAQKVKEFLTENFK